MNCPLLQAVPENEELQRRCAALLEAIRELPVIGEQVGGMGWGPMGMGGCLLVSHVVKWDMYWGRYVS